MDKILNTYLQTLKSGDTEATSKLVIGISDERAEKLVRDLIALNKPLHQSLTYNYDKQYWRISADALKGFLKTTGTIGTAE